MKCKQFFFSETSRCRAGAMDRAFDSYSVSLQVRTKSKTPDVS